MLEAWQTEAQRELGELISRVRESHGAVGRCVLKGEHELAIDVVEVRVIPQHFEHGCRSPAHGTLTVDVRSDRAWHALSELARSREAVVLQRPDFGALEMRLGDLATTGSIKLEDGSSARSTVTYTWNAP